MAEAALIGRKVAAGIEVAHGRRHSHRDLKPFDIILASDHDGGI